MENTDMLTKLLNAFEKYYDEKVVDHTFKFKSRGATIFIRKSNLSTARIIPNCVKNFPNDKELKNYFKKYKIPVDSSNAHPDYLIDFVHADNIINILEKGLRNWTFKGFKK